MGVAFSKPICAKVGRNCPSSTDQGLSTASHSSHYVLFTLCHSTLSASMKHKSKVHIVPSDVINLTKSIKILDYLIPSIAVMNRMSVYTKHNNSLCTVNMNTCIEHHVDTSSQLVLLDVHSMTLACCKNSCNRPSLHCHTYMFAMCTQY